MRGSKDTMVRSQNGGMVSKMVGPREREEIMTTSTKRREKIEKREERGEKREERDTHDQDNRVE